MIFHTIVYFILLLWIYTCYLNIVDISDDIEYQGVNVRGGIIHNMTYFDEIYEESFPYVINTMQIPRLKHIANEKKIFTTYTTYAMHASYDEVDCSESLYEYFVNNKLYLFVDCNENKRYSYCQRAYIFRYHSDTKTCSRFYRVEYTNENFSGVTVVAQLSVDRLDRIPYLLQRWKGPISLSLFVLESEMSKLDSYLKPYFSDRLIFVFYVVKEYKNRSYYAYYIKSLIRQDYEKFADPIFPLNTMRDLAIESIETTHYLLIDIDFFISSTLYDHIAEFQHVLKKSNTVVLLPTFTTEVHKLQACRRNDYCEKLWPEIPKTKEELLERFNIDFVYFNNSQYHKTININTWLTEKESRLIPFKMNRTLIYEPYGIFRRSAYDPIFHPYYIIYGRDKIEFYERMKSRKYKYFVTSSDFGVDIPHRRTNSSIGFQKKIGKIKKNDLHLMIQQYIEFWDSYEPFYK